MFDFLNGAITLFALLVAKPQIAFSPTVTAALTVICIVVIFVAWRGERRID